MITLLLANWKYLAVGGAVLALGAAWQIDRSAQYRQGVSDERAAAFERAEELIKGRERDEKLLKSLSHAELCVQLGGQWDKDTQECK